ncbi:PREDICTED: uncharacterized protein LOC104780394 [Camelina sativa]|uniref:Uncharacterized protein LOC104780394 n=1 Tax=Camelina sativa TaxID=90675 RepID=A0ABM1RMD5_CAMSA|nr:PREDICTED: uncharacterized protein LOC104780394 [Camelina sativa]
MAKYYDADTCVFWDVVDFPVPEDRMLNEFRSKVERALRMEGYIGKLKIQAYGDGDADRMDYLCAKMQLVQKAAEKHVRLSRMQLDILYWAFRCFNDELEHNETNFLVIAKDVPGKDTGTGYVCNTYKGSSPFPVEMVRMFNFSDKVLERIVQSSINELSSANTASPEENNQQKVCNAENNINELATSDIMV